MENSCTKIQHTVHVKEPHDSLNAEVIAEIEFLHRSARRVQNSEGKYGGASIKHFVQRWGISPHVSVDG